MKHTTILWQLVVAAVITACSASVPTDAFVPKKQSEPTPSLLYRIKEEINRGATIKKCSSDSIDVEMPLKPNEDGCSQFHTYGTDSIEGTDIHYRMATDSNRISVELNINTLELSHKITTHLLECLHYTLYHNGFVDDGGNVITYRVKKLAEKGLLQAEIVKDILDWESELFYKKLPTIIDYDERAFYISMSVKPVFLNEDYVTYSFISYAYTGGMHGNGVSYLQSFDRKTGKFIELDDLVKPEKIEKLRKRVVLHMASMYPIYSDCSTVDNYLQGLNKWLGLIDVSVLMGAKKADDRELISLENYPLNDPGIHGAGLVFSYEKYHVTPGADGCPQVVLTFDEIRDCLKEPLCNYRSDISEFKRCIIPDLDEPRFRYISETELDSIRKTEGLGDFDLPFPIDISDLYSNRFGKIKRHYTIDMIQGAWYGYGHHYDNRIKLSINPEGSFAIESEEAVKEDSDGEMIYKYHETVKGRYVYDSYYNKLKLLNENNIELNGETLEVYIKLANPENEDMIIHSIEGDTMWIADYCADLRPYYRIRK